jgi:hypothetical protein
MHLQTVIGARIQLERDVALPARQGRPRNSLLACVAPMKSGARFGASSQPDPVDATHGRLKDSDLARYLKRREMALWALEKKRQISPFLWDGTSRHFSPFEGLPASHGPGLRTVSGAKRRRGGSSPSRRGFNQKELNGN